MPIAKIIRFSKLGPRKQLLLAEALLALAAAAAAIRFLPFRRAVRMGSNALAPTAAGARDAILRESRWSVEAAATVAPWRTVCFQKGLALQWMLRRRGIEAVLHYGIRKQGPGEIEAHVWIAAEDRIVIGEEAATGFKSVTSFPSA